MLLCLFNCSIHPSIAKSIPIFKLKIERSSETTTVNHGTHRIFPFEIEIPLYGLSQRKLALLLPS